MDALSMAAVRKDLADLIGKVHYRKERMVITRHDKPVAALVPMDDVELLERLEDRLDILEALEAIEDYDANGGISLQRLKADLDL